MTSTTMDSDLSGPPNTDPYQALFLLPSAPRTLVTEVYRLLEASGHMASDDTSPSGAAESRAAAYARIIDMLAPGSLPANGASKRPASEHPKIAGCAAAGSADAASMCSRTRVLYPWDVLHVQQSAPAQVVDAACRFRTGPIDTEGSKAAPASETQAHVANVDVPLAVTTPAGRTLPGRLRRAAESFVGLARRQAPTSDSDAQEARRWAELGKEAKARGPVVAAGEPVLGRGAEDQVRAYLVTESGAVKPRWLALDSRPVTLGTDPACDVLLSGAELGAPVATFARIWPRDNGFMLHVIDRSVPISLNGRKMSWALLEDGDRLELGDDTLRFVDGDELEPSGNAALNRAAASRTAYGVRREEIDDDPVRI